MHLIQKKELNKIVVNHEVFKFELARDGIYLISIAAKCKNWLQNARRRFNDDDLAIELDNLPFYELKGKRKEFSSSASWNGNDLKNARKTCYFITSLKSGFHEIKFITDAAPFLEKIEIYELSQDEHKTLTLEKKLIPEPEEGRLTFDIIIKNVELENIDISAKAENKDKLQVKIDGNIEENSTSKKYKIWYWIGSQLKGDKKDLKKDIKSSQGLFHSLEFKGKGNPVIENIVFSFKDVHFNKLGRVVLYKDITLFNKTYLRSEPSDEKKDTIIAELKNGDIIEIIEERVTGKWVSAKSYIWHKVKYQEKEGYVFSSFVEIEGQGREIVIEKRNWSFIILPVILIILVGMSALIQFKDNSFLKSRNQEILQASLASQTIVKKKAISRTEIDFSDQSDKKVLVDLDKDGKEEEITFRILSANYGEYWFDIFLENESGIQKINQMNHRNIYGYSAAVSVWDVKQLSSNLLLLEVFAGRTIYSYFYTMNKDKSITLLPIVSDGENSDALGSRSGIDFINLPYEDNLVYIYYQDFPNGMCQGAAEIYKMYDHKLIKMFDLKEAKDWCENYKG